MFCALTNTKNSVMTPIFTNTTINGSNDNNKNTSASNTTTTTTTMQTLSNDNDDDDITMAEIEMDTLNELGGGTFHHLGSFYMEKS